MNLHGAESAQNKAPRGQAGGDSWQNAQAHDASTPHNEQPAAEEDSVFWDDAGVTEISDSNPMQTARALAKRGMREAGGST